MAPITTGGEFRGDIGFSTSSTIQSSITDLVVILVVDTFVDKSQSTIAGQVAILLSGELIYM